METGISSQQGYSKNIKHLFKKRETISVSLKLFIVSKQ